MALIRIDGRDLAVRNLSTSKIMHVEELQRQSGLKLKELSELVAEADVLASVVVSFLTQRTAGIPVRWDDLRGGSMEELGQLIAEPGDPKPEGEAVADPPASATSESEDVGGSPREVLAETS